MALKRVDDRLYQGLLHQGIRITDLSDGQQVAPEIKNIPSSVYDIQRRGTHIYFGTPAGIIVYDQATGRQWRYANSENRDWDVIADECPHLLLEEDGSVWVGHNTHGFSHGTAPQAFAAEPDPSAGRLPYFLRSVSTVLEDQRGNLWLGYHEGGIRRLKVTDFTEEGSYLTNSKPTVKRSSIFTMLEDQRGTIWVGTYESGLLRYDPTKDDFVPSGISFTKLGGSDVRDLIEDRDGYLWAAVHGFGLTRIDPADGTTQAFPAVGLQPLSPYVFNMACDAQNRIWMVSVQGVYRLEADRKTVTAVLTKKRAEPGRFSHRAYVLQLAADGTVWVGTEEGLVALGEDGQPTGTISTCLMGATIRGLELGAEGDLWVAARGKLYQYFPQDDNVFTYELPAYFAASQFLRGAHATLSDGRVAFGYNNGLVSFLPAELQRPRFIPRPVVVDLDLFGDDAKQVRVRPDTNVASLRLPVANQGLAVDLSTLGYRDPDAVRYEARLLPVQAEWQLLEGTLPRYTLYRLPSGEHTLEFRATVANGVGYSEVSRLRVSVPQPWYLSPWAFCGYFLGLTTLFLGSRSYVK
ncbi:MAG: two-component regulator propeller domain-containing protein, partial [Bacteroidota bacterium]